MLNNELLNLFASEVENIVSRNPYAVKQFREQIRIFNCAWRKYWQAMTGEPEPYDDPTGKNGKPGYEYDQNCKWWFPIDTPELPPDPTKWEMKDKYPCYYAILAVIYDSVKGKVAPFTLFKGSMDEMAFIYMLKYGWGFDKDTLETAIKWVNTDLVEKEEAERKSQAKTFGFRPKKKSES